MQEAIKKLISAPYQMPSTYAAQQICQMMGIKPF
jgi:hypothetical protein